VGSEEAQARQDLIEAISQMQNPSLALEQLPQMPINPALTDLDTIPKVAI
jgi:hypothetical protein